MFADLGVGTALSSLFFNTFGVKGGLTLQANLGTVERQVLRGDYASSYAMSLDFTAGLANDVDALAKLLKLNVQKADFRTSFVLATSPKATSFEYSPLGFQMGDTITGTLKLDPTSVSFGIPPVQLYNVDEIQLYRYDLAMGSVDLVATFPASAGQTEFDLTWSAMRDADGIFTSYWAFLDTVLLPIGATGFGELEQIYGCPQITTFDPSIYSEFTGEVTMVFDPSDPGCSVTDVPMTIGFGASSVRIDGATGGSLIGEIIDQTVDGNEVSFTIRIGDRAGLGLDEVNTECEENFTKSIADIIGTNEITFTGTVESTCDAVEGLVAVAPGLAGTHSVGDGPWFGVDSRAID